MPNETPNAQPAPAAQAPAPVAAPTPIEIRPDQLVKVKVDGKDVVQPWGNVQTSLQLEYAARRRLEQAEALRASNQDAIAFRDGVNAHIERGDIEGADAKFRSYLEKTAGRSLRSAAKPNTSAEAPDGLDETNPQMRQFADRLASQEERLETVTRSTSAERVIREVDRVLNTYPIYDKNHESYDPDAREAAELDLLAAKDRFPNRPVDEIALATHTRHSNMLARALTRTRDHREEAQRQHAGVPPSQGTPGTAERKRFTRADAKNGVASGAVAAAQKQGRGLLRAMFPNS